MDIKQRHAVNEEDEPFLKNSSRLIESDDEPERAPLKESMSLKKRECLAS